MNEPVSEERLRNVRAWAAARTDAMSGATVIVGAIDELLKRRAADVDLGQLLLDCTEKLSRYRYEHSGAYVGGVEYTELQRRIAMALDGSSNSTVVAPHDAG
jgi:hypothetical protein